MSHAAELIPAPQNGVAPLAPMPVQVMHDQPVPSSFAHFTFDDVVDMARAIVNGGLFPQFDTMDKAISLMLLCQAKGLHPMQAVERYDIVKGRPAMKSQAMQAAFQAEGGKIQWHQSDDTVCDATFSHPSGGSLRLAWDVKRASKAQLTGKGTWQAHPAQMLRARCVSEGVRAVLPGVVLGIYTPEETAEFEPAAPVQQARPQNQQNVPRQQQPKPKELDAPPAESDFDDKEAAYRAYARHARDLGLDVLTDAKDKIAKAKVFALFHDQTDLMVANASASDFDAARNALESYKRGQDARTMALGGDPNAVPQIDDDMRGMASPFPDENETGGTLDMNVPQTLPPAPVTNALMGGR